MDFDEEEPTQMELNPNPALHTVPEGTVASPSTFETRVRNPLFTRCFDRWRHLERHLAARVLGGRS